MELEETLATPLPKARQMDRDSLIENTVIQNTLEHRDPDQSEQTF
jgi:hypothetical protein